MILNTLFALLSTLCFGVIFNIRGKKLIFSAVGGGLGWITYLLILDFKLSTTFALFAASIVIAIYSEIMARLLKTPVTIIEISAIIPLVPGNGMYYTMYYSILGETNKSIATGIHTLASAGAIAVGLVLISSISKLINLRNKK